MRISTVISDIIQIINRSHSDLQNLAADDHTQYLNVARHDLAARHPLSVLDPLVCSEAEADGKITAHEGLADPHTVYLNVARHDLAARHPLSVLDPLVCSEAEADSKIATHAAAADPHTVYVLRSILTTQGDIFIRGAAGVERLGIGASGYFLKSQGAGSNPVWDAVVSGVGIEATTDDFRANPATGTSTDPSQINNNNTADSTSFTAVDQYAEVNFKKVVCIKRWRRYGMSSENSGNRYKIQYYNLSTHTWVDWVTDIPGYTTVAWSNYSTATEVLTDKIRWIMTTHAATGYIPEADVVF